jgi:outer membrane protein assembly factor BamA
MDSYKIETGKGDYDSRRLHDYIKQKPNKRIIFWKFYLSLYNLSNPEKENGFNNWLRRIGEPPAIYDEDLKARSAEQLDLYMKNKGFYNAEITDTTIIKKHKAKIYYNVVPNQPYRIRNINYFFQDATLAPMILADTTSTKFKSGELFDVDVLQEERVRIESLLRDSGYYAFNRDYIYYSVDSSLQSHLVDVTLDVRNYPKQDRNGKIIHVDHPVFKIRKVYMITDYEVMSNAVSEDSGSVVQKDTLLYDGIHIVYGKKPNIRPGVITQKNYITPTALYDASDVQRTYRNLSSLSAFSKVNIRFSEVESDSSLLDCEVIVAPSTKQAYQLKLEGTNSAGNIGAAANVSYRHRNLFGGSEQFDLSFKGAIEALSENISEADSTYSGLNLMQEFGVEARLRIPKFLLPFKSEQFIRKYNPQTNIRLSYNYQKRPDYIRTLANASFGYDWRGNAKTLHKVYPIEASLILTPYKSQGFQDWLDGKYLFYSYEPHLIIDTRYSVVWTNQKLLKNQNFQDIRLNLETAGNLMYAAYSLLAPDPGKNNYQLLGVDFAQYLKVDIDFRSYTFLYEDVLLVLRGFAGVGYAYLNSTAMPFEKQYFSGGANSIRAWRVKSLGPGSYEDPTKSLYPNQTGDVKLEVNMEYRFKLFWKLEAALFMDVGNIWSLSSLDDREGAGFEFNRFYKELAVGTGAGTRFVSSFFVFRFDVGVPLRNPYPIEGHNWLPGNRGVAWQDLTFNLAIGYPF